MHALSAVDVWTKYDAIEARLTAPASERMLDLAGVGPGSHVLDLATGRGAQSGEGLESGSFDVR